MVFMPVGQHHAQGAFAFREQGIEQRNDHIHAHLGIIGKHEAAINQHGPLSALPFLAVQTYFSKPPQRGNGKMPVRHGNSLNICPVWDGLPAENVVFAKCGKPPAAGEFGRRGRQPYESSARGGERLPTKSAARKLRVGRGFAAP